MANPLSQIKHIVVVMMENRSFDNLLGWLYADTNNVPPHNIPSPAHGPNTFAGLVANRYYNEYRNHEGKLVRVNASRPPKPWQPKYNANLVPDPDPKEEFRDMTEQIFGTSAPPPGAVPNMSGFLTDYLKVYQPPDQIMESFGPSEANVINALARNFAVCDAWYASCPCQTWPNRGFVHTGSSDGHINNDDYEPYDIATIFNVLQNRSVSWNVFHDSTVVPSLTWGQFLPQLSEYTFHFAGMSSFFRHCAGANGARLPRYSFIEPRFVPELGLFKIDYPEDYHPPHNVCRGEQFLAQIYNAVRNSPYRDEILLIITFDEHGGCYDHVPPLPKAIAPQPGAVSRYDNFHFDRFGVRIPTIVISSYVNPGTVFRAPANSPAPYDHTSILATLRDWLGFARKDPSFLPSPRIVAAPTLEPVLTLPQPNKAWPEISAQCQLNASDEDLNTPLNDVQRSLLAIARRAAAPDLGAALQPEFAIEAKSQETYRDALKFFHPEINL